MNKNNLSKILGKKGLTGAELGRLAILNNVELLNNYYKGKKQGGGFFTEEEINAAAKNLTGFQKDIYCYYLDLYKVINFYFTIGDAQYQQAMNGIHSLMFRITLLWNALKNENQIKSLPLMLTEAKYKELKAKTDAEAFKNKESYIELFIEALGYYVDKAEDDEKTGTKNIINPLLKAHENKPICNEFLKDTYINDNFDEYYSYNEKCSYKLIDGTSSENVTVKEYMKDFLNRPLFKKLEPEHIENIKELFRTRYRGILKLLKEHDIEPDFKEIEDKLEQENKATAPRISDFIHELKNYLIATNQESVADDISELQKDIFIIPKEAEPTQRDIIQYYNFLIAPYQEEENNIKVFECFKSELPDVAKAIHADLLKHKEIKIAMQNKNEQDLYKPFIDWKVLYKADAYTYRNRVKENFTEENPQARNGIAFIKEDSNTIKYIEDGIYKPNIKILDTDKIASPDITIENLRTFRENILKIVDELLIPAFKNVHAINYFYRDIESIYKIEGLQKAYGQDTTGIITKIEVVNGMVDMVCHELYMLYRETKEGNIKTEYVRQAFRYIDIEDLLPTEEQQEKAREVLAEVKNFKGKDFSPKFLYLYVKGNKDTLQVINNEE